MHTTPGSREFRLCVTAGRPKSRADVVVVVLLPEQSRWPQLSTLLIVVVYRVVMPPSRETLSSGPPVRRAHQQ